MYISTLKDVQQLDATSTYLQYVIYIYGLLKDAIGT